MHVPTLKSLAAIVLVTLLCGRPGLRAEPDELPSLVADGGWSPAPWADLRPSTGIFSDLLLDCYLSTEDVSDPLGEDPFAAAKPKRHPARGLLDFRDSFPLAGLHLQPPTSPLPMTPEGGFGFRVDFDWANHFATGRGLLVDAETYRLRLEGWLAVLPSLYVGAEVSAMARDGGVLDAFIENFHDAFDLSNGNRDEQPRDAFEIVVTDDDGRARDLEPGAGVSDVVLKLQWLALSGAGWIPDIAVQGLVSLPTANAGFGSSSVDLGASISLHAEPLDDLHLHCTLGGTYLPEPEVEGLEFRDLNAQAAVGVEYVVDEAVSVFLQYMIFSPLFDARGKLGESRHYVAGGVKADIAENLEFSVSVIENILNFDNSADLTIHLGLLTRF